tara:strand:+ start:1472 stop:1582 length:111 start_codon:yes stop_codon:yes gene_type:complete
MKTKTITEEKEADSDNIKEYLEAVLDDLRNGRVYEL